MHTQDQLEGVNKLKLRSACRDANVKGYSKMNNEQMRAALAQTVATATKEKNAAPAAPADNVNGVNGKSRPKAGGKCAEVWNWLDKNRSATLADVRAAAEKKGWNVNNAACELYAWRRFNGITGRVK